MLSIFYKIIDFYSILIIISFLASWVDPMHKMQIFNTIRKLTDPYLRIFKVIIPIGNGAIDISPVIALWILNIVKRLLVKFMFF